MPYKGPQGQKRKADVIGNAVLVMRIATGQEPGTGQAPMSAAAELGSKGGDRVSSTRGNT